MITALLPLVLLLGMVAFLVAALWNFSLYRREWLKDRIILLWPERRREILHLHANNGFILMMERLMSWSEKLLKFSWLAAFPAFFLGAEGVGAAALMISVTFFGRSAVICMLARRKLSLLEELWDCDGFGSYARAAADWRVILSESQETLKFSGLISVILLALFVSEFLT